MKERVKDKQQRSLKLEKEQLAILKKERGIHRTSQ